MNILMDIAHPAHVHLLKNTYFELLKKGHKIVVTVKHIPAAISLLDSYNIPYINLGKGKDNLINKAILQLKYNYKIWKIVKREKIDLGFCSSITIAHISRITKMKSIVLDDDDDSVEPLFVKFAHPFVDTILSPKGVERAAKQSLHYDGYHELAYLHPKRFIPDPNILKEIGVKENDTYFILRFNAFKAHHDVGVEGLSLENKRRLISILKKRGKVFITSERDIDEEFAQYQLRISPEKIHSLIYYATMLIGDSQTMTSEAAVLGTPAIRSNSFVGRINVLEEFDHKHNLAFGFLPNDNEKMFAKIEELLALKNLKEEFANRRDRMLNDKIDVTAFFLWFIENYPNSAKEMRENPNSLPQFTTYK